jgi:nucleoid DNA-binding protein
MTRELLQRLANKHNIPLQTVREAVLHQFKYVAQTMKDGGFEAVRLPYLGKFHVLPGRLKHLQKYERSDNSK